MSSITRRAASGLFTGLLLLTGCTAVESGTPVAALDSDGGADRPTLPDAPEERSGGVDLTKGIKGVLAVDYPTGSEHVTAPSRVAYDHMPPLGGAHDAIWAPCNGVVYAVAVRTEHLVHSLEHGAVWITYDPERVRGADVEELAAKVEGEPYTVMSPFPGQRSPVSVQSWGRQLPVDSADDPRVDRFIAATRGNPDLTPEPGASCDMDSRLFDQDAPPPFAAAPPGPDAVPPTRR